MERWEPISCHAGKNWAHQLLVNSTHRASFRKVSFLLKTIQNGKPRPALDLILSECVFNTSFPESLHLKQKLALTPGGSKSPWNARPPGLRCWSEGWICAWFRFRLRRCCHCWAISMSIVGCHTLGSDRRVPFLIIGSLHELSREEHSIKSI